MYSNDLIFGKDKTERIVSIEANEDLIEIFTRDKADAISSRFEPNSYWLLTTNRLSSSDIELQGDLYYKYGKTFKDRKDFFKYKQYLRAKHIDFYAIGDTKEAIMVRNGYTYFKGLTPKELSVFSFDLETTGLVHDDTSKILCIATSYRDFHGRVHKQLFSYENYISQADMLEAFGTYLRECNPDILIGHNILMFDIPYMQFIADKEGIQLVWGRDKSAISIDKRYESKFRKDGSQFYHYHKVKCYGREICDTLFLTIKFDATERKLESYGLKPVIKQLGFEKPNRVFYEAAKIRENYTIPEEWEKIKAYCIDDSDDPITLFDHMVAPLFYSSQSIPKSFQSVVETATGSQINSIMVRAYLQQKHSIPKAEESSSYEGGISIGNPGVYRNVWKVDVASLYPSIMIEYAVGDPKKDPKGYFQEMVKTFTAERLKNKKLFKETKDEYYDGLQAAQKIFINSAYGFLGTGGLNFNAPDQAAFVTEKGREILTKAIEWSKTFNFTLANADTDSISITLDGRELSEGERQFYLNTLNMLYPERIKFEDDGYYETVIIVAAKNYVLKKKGQKPKYKGSAIKATLKEPRLKDFIKDIIKEIGVGRQDYIGRYNAYAREIVAITDITGWCTKKTITDKVLNGTRSNETKVLDAIASAEYREGDKVYVFFRNDKTLCLRENFTGDYSHDALLKKLYDTATIFEALIDVNIFPNYSLKKNKKALKELIYGDSDPKSNVS